MAQQQSPSNKVQRWALFTKQNPWTVDILELISFLEFYCYFQQHVDLKKKEKDLMLYVYVEASLCNWLVYQLTSQFVTNQI